MMLIDELRTGGSAREVAFCPQLKDEQLPEFVSVITNTFRVLVNQLLDILRLKESLLTKAHR
jgi:hypothetical protein